MNTIMNKTLNIKSNTLEDRSILLGVLYSLGGIFHRKSEPNYYTLEKAKEAYTHILTLSINYGNDGLDIQGWNINSDVNFSEDPAKAIELIKELINKAPKSILVKNVGDYEAIVEADGIHIYGQVISFDKFDEIATAVDKLNN